MDDNTEMNQFIEFRNKYSTGKFKVKLLNKNGHFSLGLYKCIKLPVIGRVGYGPLIQAIPVSLGQLAFSQSLYMSSHKACNEFGRENMVNFAKYKAYVMQGFMENATDSPMDLMHACLGMAAETGEVLDQIKKHVFHGKPLDRMALLLELGDSDWYRAALLSLMDISYADILAANKAKLDERYKNGRQDLTFRDTKMEYIKVKEALQVNEH